MKPERLLSSQAFALRMVAGGAHEAGSVAAMSPRSIFSSAEIQVARHPAKSAPAGSSPR
ncbi:MAG: hypothetical protein IT510_07960 [Sulfuritalea sp.]|jgi:hypothetical protein|nr:hypothetical protein [Sulfuritalea sp.]